MPRACSDDDRDGSRVVAVTTRVGLLGADAASVADVVSDAGGEPVLRESTDDSRETPAFDTTGGDLDVVAALGEDAVLAAAGVVDAPILPVDAGPGYGGVRATDRSDALAALATGDFEVAARRTLSVTANGSTVRALADATLVTSDPADISEFRVENSGRRVDTVRADGVVAATPTGSRGYAADAGGPHLDFDVDAVAVVPIAPFRVERPNWVLGPPASLTVVRGEAAVDVYVDGRHTGPLGPHEPVELDWGTPLPVATVPVSRCHPRDD